MQGTVATTTTLTASATQITYGQNVTFTATVTPQAGNNVATGTVTFLDGTTTLATVTLNASGVAVFSTTTLTVGTHTITASYSGDSKNNPSISSAKRLGATQSTVTTTTTLSASATQLITGQTVTFTAQVAPQSGTGVATGAITFLDGTTSLGLAQLNGNGAATLSATSLAVGTHSISASYGGDSKDNGSVSQTVSVVVGQSTVGTSTSLSASATQLTLGQSETFTAKVAPQSGSNVPTGTVTFLDGTTTLGTSSLSGSGTAIFTTTALAAGTHLIVASYGGASKDSSSASSAVSVVVTAVQGAAATTTTLSASSTQLLPSQSITFTAAVAPQSGSNIPTGIVTFFDGSKGLGTAQVNASGGTTLNLASLAVGTHSISATYGGDANDSPSTSAILTVDVSTPEYALVVSATNVNLAPGQPSTLDVTLIPESGFNLPINLGCSGLPKGTSCTFNPSIVTPNGSPVMSTVTIMFSNEAALAPKHGPDHAPDGGFALGWVMPWGFIPLLGLAKTRRRSRIAQWFFRFAVAATLAVGSLWVSGCGYSANGAAFLVTITASASNAQTHTSQITVHLQQ